MQDIETSLLVILQRTASISDCAAENQKSVSTMLAVEKEYVTYNIFAHVSWCVFTSVCTSVYLGVSPYVFVKRYNVVQ